MRFAFSGAATLAHSLFSMLCTGDQRSDDDSYTVHGQGGVGPASVKGAVWGRSMDALYVYHCDSLFGSSPGACRMLMQTVPSGYTALGN